MRILVVEPAEDLGKVLVATMLQARFLCDHAKSAQQAVTLADDNQPDIVVLELALPGHNGVEFLYEFRSHADWTNIPIIFYTQVSAEECGLSARQMQQLGVAAHLYKPTTTLKVLQTTIQEVLS